jgi:hypothetical protein
MLPALLLRRRGDGVMLGVARRGLSLHARAASKSWEQSWQAAVDKVVGNVGSYEQSAQQLRDMTKAKLIKFTDLRDDPERFFLAHRTLARRAPQLGPGFWIRMTVSFNLCGGTVSRRALRRWCCRPCRPLLNPPPRLPLCLFAGPGRGQR